MAEEVKETEKVEGNSEESKKPSDSSESIASLFKRGLGAEFIKAFDKSGDDGGLAEERTSQKADPEEPEEETEEVAARKPAEEEEEKVEVGALKELERRLALSDVDKARLGQEAAFLKQKVAELDPLIQLGLAVRKDPVLFAEVKERLSGQKIDGKDVGKMTAAQFLDNVRAAVREEVVTILDTHTTATREWNDVEAKAHKAIPNYDVVSRHPQFMAWVNQFDNLVEQQLLDVPQGENRLLFAMRKASETLIASNPEYVKAVEELGKKKGKESVAKKLEASVGAPSKGSATEATPKLTRDETDRMSILTGALRGSTFRRLPSARGR